LAPKPAARQAPSPTRSPSGSIPHHMSWSGLPDQVVDKIMALKTQLEMEDELKELRAYFDINNVTHAILPLVDKFPHVVCRERMDIDHQYLRICRNVWQDPRTARYLLHIVRGRVLNFENENGFFAEVDERMNMDFEELMKHACEMVMNNFGIETMLEAEILVLYKMKTLWLSYKPPQVHSSEGTLEMLKKCHKKYMKLFKLKELELKYVNN
jgi:hypothetical protein